MDSLTHTVIGACLGEAIAGKQLGKKAMLLGILANNFPDVDMVATFWESEVTMLMLHRGITHSILCNVILTFVFAKLFQRIYLKYNMDTKRWLWLFGSGLFLHIVLDSFTTYGTGWFEPFSNYRVTFNTIFILDPAFTLPVLISAIALWILKKDSVKRKFWWKCGIAISGIYFALICFNKLYVNKVIKSNLSEQQLRYDDFMVAPTPLNNLLWYTIVKNKGEFYMAYYSVFDKDKILKFETFKQNDSVLDQPCEKRSLELLKHFSKGYYTAKIENDTVVFSDMRFGQLNGWTKNNTPFVFNLIRPVNCTKEQEFVQAPFASGDGKAIEQIVDRIKGN